jgi:hypothetical protein
VKPIPNVFYPQLQRIVQVFLEFFLAMVLFRISAIRLHAPWRQTLPYDATLLNLNNPETRWLIPMFPVCPLSRTSGGICIHGHFTATFVKLLNSVCSGDRMVSVGTLVRISAFFQCIEQIEGSHELFSSEKCAVERVANQISTSTSP